MRNDQPEALDRIFGDPGLLEDAKMQAEWRDEKAAEYPDDERNLETADALRALVQWIEASPTSPLLVRLDAALGRLYDSDDDALTFEPSVTDRLGRMGFDYITEPVGFLEELLDEIETFLSERDGATMEDLAALAAEHAFDERHKDHRGVMRWHQFVAIFGNDGYRQVEAVRTQVEVLRQLLEEAGIQELAFGLDERKEWSGKPVSSVGYTWALLVRSDNLSGLHRMVWEAHRIAHGFKRGDRLFGKAQGGDIA